MITIIKIDKLLNLIVTKKMVDLEINKDDLCSNLFFLIVKILNSNNKEIIKKDGTSVPKLENLLNFTIK